jgi:predicted nucleic acid-binding protein
MKIYLDNCAYNRPFDDQRQIRIFLEAQAKMYIQDLITEGKLDLVCSYMSVYENNDNPDKENRIVIDDFFTNAVLFIDYDKADIIEKHAKTIMNFNIKHKDAIHLSCAIEAKSDYFITTDDDILKKYRGTDIKPCSPVEFIAILEDKIA